MLGPHPATELPNAPYAGYTPAPGVVPPIEAPVFPASCWNPSNKCVVTASQPVIPVPVTQEIHRKEKVIEVDQTIVTDRVVPQVYHQEVFYEVPKLALDIKERKLNVPQIEITEEPREIPCAVGFNFRLVPVWEMREVPRLFPAYSGKQEVIEVGIPQVQIVDKKVENEVPIYVGEKTVEKEVIEEEGVEVIQYKYVKKEEEVPVYNYRPVCELEVSVPAPVVVPVPIAPKEKALETEHISWDEYKKTLGKGGLAKVKRQMRTLCHSNNPCNASSPPQSPPFTPKLQRMPHNANSTDHHKE